MKVMFIFEVNTIMKERLQEAIDQHMKKFLGKNACGSGWDFTFIFIMGPELTYVEKNSSLKA